jgi:hypothetical protein
MDWGRRQEPHYEVVSFKAIRNVGRGVAIRVYMRNADEWFKQGKRSSQRPWEFSTQCDDIPTLAPNETVKIPGEVVLNWNTGAPDQHGTKTISIVIGIFCWDTRWTRYETVYYLHAFLPSDTLSGNNLVAPGLFLSDRVVHIRSRLSFRIENAARGVARKAARLCNRVRGNSTKG